MNGWELQGGLKMTILKLEEVAEILKIHKSTVYRLLKKGEIPAMKIGADYRFIGEELESWVKSRTVEVKP